MARIPGMHKPRTRFRVGGEALIENAAGTVFRLDEHPPGSDGPSVAVMLSPAISPSSAAAALRLLAAELEQQGLGL
jgi:hypothetical protein